MAQTDAMFLPLASSNLCIVAKSSRRLTMITSRQSSGFGISNMNSFIHPMVACCCPMTSPKPCVETTCGHDSCVWSELPHSLVFETAHAVVPMAQMLIATVRLIKPAVRLLHAESHGGLPSIVSPQTKMPAKGWVAVVAPNDTRQCRITSRSPVRTVTRTFMRRSLR